MPRDSQGVYSLPLGTLVKAGDTVLVSQHNPAMKDIELAVTKSLARDGRGGMTGALSMGGNKITGLAPGTALTDAVTVGQWTGGVIPTPTPTPGTGTGEGVPLHSYPGTTVTEDPNRWDHSNKQLEQAQDDTLNPLSENFGKWIDIYAGKGEGKRHADEWTGSGDNAIPTATDIVSGDPIPRRFLAENGDTLLDSWSQNGRYEVATFPTPIDTDNLPGNLRSGVRIRLLPGARVRRAPRYTGVSYPADILRPLILCCDPNPTTATTVGGIDTQSDVYTYVRVVCIGDSGFIGENHRWGYREHHNDISLNAASDFYIETNHYGTISDALYIGAGNIGGGSRNRHNKRGDIAIVADGRNQNNRNVVSIIDCVGLRGTVRGDNFSRAGGAGNDPYNPNSGTLAPGIVDVEPNTFTDDPRIDDIELDVYAEDSGASAVSTLLIDNNDIPTPLGSMKFTGKAVRCTHGKHTLIGAVDMATPYRITVEMDSEDCGSPFEVLAGQGCTHRNGRNLRSFRAGLIGFTGFASPQDFNRDYETDQELGSIDTAAIQVRGWNGGGIRGGQMINGRNKGYHFLSNTGTSPIRDLTIEGLQFINRANITSQSMQHAFFVDPSDGGAQIFPSTIIERDVRYNGIQNSRWAASGSYVKNVPGFGPWEQGQEVYGDPALERGSPRVLRTFAANTTGVPFWYQQELIQPVPDASAFGDSVTTGGFVTNNMRVENLSGGMVRLTATGPNAYWVRNAAVASFNLNLHAPFSGTQTVYAGGFTVQAPAEAPSPSNGQLSFGQWFYDTTGGVLGLTRGIVGGGASGSMTDSKYGDRFRIGYQSGGVAAIHKLNESNAVASTVTSTGVSVGNLYPGVLILIPGESIIVRGITVA
jgi:hypothetical protein